MLQHDINLQIVMVLMSTESNPLFRSSAHLFFRDYQCSACEHQVARKDSGFSGSIEIFKRFYFFWHDTSMFTGMAKTEMA